MAQPNAVQDTRFYVQGRMRRERCKLQRFQGRESDEFATVQVRASAGYPEPVQVISECVATSVDRSLEFCRSYIL